MVTDGLGKGLTVDEHVAMALSLSHPANNPWRDIPEDAVAALRYETTEMVLQSTISDMLSS